MRILPSRWLPWTKRTSQRSSPTEEQLGRLEGAPSKGVNADRTLPLTPEQCPRRRSVPGPCAE